MSLKTKIINFIKKIFHKDVKTLTSPEKTGDTQNLKPELNYFEKYRKEHTIVKTMVCDGDGLGIQNKFDY